jgi:hypothetical protein
MDYLTHNKAVQRRYVKTPFIDRSRENLRADIWFNEPLKARKFFGWDRREAIEDQKETIKHYKKLRKQRGY